MIKKIGFIFLYITSFLFCYNTFAATRTCVASGDWSDKNIWSNSLKPTTSDDVIIGNGFTVTIDEDADAKSITIGAGTSGVLIYEKSNTRTLNVINDVTINVGATFSSQTTGALNSTHYLNVGGNLVNNGTLNFYGSSKRYVTIKFTGASSKSFSGTGATTDIYKIIINKGNSIASVLELNTSNFSVRGVTTNGTDFLTLTNGLFKLSGSFTGSSIVLPITGTYGFASTYWITSSTGFCLNNANYTVNAQPCMVMLNGKLEILAGTFNIGNDYDHDLAFFSGGTLSIAGGTLNVSESIGSYEVASHTYSQTGGTVNVCTFANDWGNYGSFHLTNSATFNMTGGSIVIRNPNSASSASSSFDYFNFAGTKSITGGTVQFGDAVTSGAKTFNVSGGYFPNLLINNSGGNHQVNLSTLNSIAPEVFLKTTLQNNTKLDAGVTYACNMTFGGLITIGTGAIYNQGTSSHTWKGDFTNNGTFSTNNGTVILNGSSAQTIGGSSVSTLYNMNVNNSSGVVISKGPTITNLLTFTSGNITAATSTEPLKLDVSASVTGNGDGKCVVGYCAKNTNATTKFTFPVGTTSTQRLMSVTPSSTSATTWLVKYFSSGYSDASITGVDMETVSSSEYWTVDRVGASNASIELTWNAASGITDVSKVWVAHYNGSDWEIASSEGGSGNLLAGVKSSRSNWSSYSPFTFGFSPNGTVLPIELISFTANKFKNKVLVSWSTAAEINNDYFVVERSFDGHHFSPIARLDGAGNSTHLINYQIQDEDFVNGVNYYKLIQTDYNGDETKSDIVSIDMSQQSEMKIKIVNLLGQEVNEHFSGIVYDVYSDGTLVKRLQ
jgi:hypothetical protein